MGSKFLWLTMTVAFFAWEAKVSQARFGDELALTILEANKAVSVESQTVSGELDLSGVDIPVAISLKHCTFEGPVNLSMSQVPGSLDLSGSIFKGGLSLKGTRIGHHLILDGCVFKSPSQPALDTRRMEVKGNLRINNARFFGPWSGKSMELQGDFLADMLNMEGDLPPTVELDELRTGGSITISRASLGMISLSSARIGLGFYLSSTQFAGDANFIGSHIGATLYFRGVSFKDPVYFDQVAVKGNFLFTPNDKGNLCKVESVARFLGVSIGGTAEFKGVGFKDMLVFEQAKVKGSIFFIPDDKGNQCEIGGVAWFLGAHIGGQVNFEGISFKDMVVFDQAEVKGNLFFKPDGKGNPCEIKDEARFHGSHIGGQVNFLGAIFRGDVVFYGAHIKGETFLWDSELQNLDAEGAHFGKIFSLDGSEIKGDLNIRDARVYNLVVEGLKGIEGKLKLTGCEYLSLESKETLWKLIKEKRILERQPYEFFENYCRQIGEGDFARDVYYEWRKQAAPKWKRLHTWLWDKLLRYTVGYGVRPIRLLWWVSGFFGFLCLLFMFVRSWFFEPVNGSVRPSRPEALWLSIKTIMPFGLAINRQRDAVWQHTLPGAIVATFFRVILWFVISVGLLAIAGVFQGI